MAVDSNALRGRLRCRMGSNKVGRGSYYILPRPTLDSTAIVLRPTLADPILHCSLLPSYPFLPRLPRPTVSDPILPKPIMPSYPILAIFVRMGFEKVRGGSLCFNHPEQVHSTLHTLLPLYRCSFVAVVAT